MRLTFEHLWVLGVVYIYMCDVMCLAYFPPSHSHCTQHTHICTRCSSDDPHLLSLLTLTQSFLTTDKQVSHYPILRIFANPAEHTVVVTTQLPKDRSGMLNEDGPVRVRAVARDLMYKLPPPLTPSTPHSSTPHSIHSTLLHPSLHPLHTPPPFAPQPITPSLPHPHSFCHHSSTPLHSSLLHPSCTSLHPSLLHPYSSTPHSTPPSTLTPPPLPPLPLTLPSHSTPPSSALPPPSSTLTPPHLPPPHLPPPPLLTTPPLTPPQVEEAVFDCDVLLHAHTWHHVAVVIGKTGLRGKAKATLFVDGNVQGTQKVWVHACMCVHVSMVIGACTCGRTVGELGEDTFSGCCMECV